jgi:hypothetical protein
MIQYRRFEPTISLKKPNDLSTPVIDGWHLLRTAHISAKDFLKSRRLSSRPGVNIILGGFLYSTMTFSVSNLANVCFPGTPCLPNHCVWFSMNMISAASAFAISPSRLNISIRL